MVHSQVLENSSRSSGFFFRSGYMMGVGIGLVIRFAWNTLSPLTGELRTT